MGKEPPGQPTASCFSLMSGKPTGCSWHAGECAPRPGNGMTPRIPLMVRHGHANLAPCPAQACRLFSTFTYRFLAWSALSYWCASLGIHCRHKASHTNPYCMVSTGLPSQGNPWQQQLGRRFSAKEAMPSMRHAPCLLPLARCMMH